MVTSTDWPLVYINFLLFCVAFWLTIGIVMMIRKNIETRLEIRRINKLIAEVE